MYKRKGIATSVIPMIAFANTDGGLLAIGIEDKSEIAGIIKLITKINN